MLDLTKLTTEQRNPKTMELDSFSPIDRASFAAMPTDAQEQAADGIRKAQELFKLDALPDKIGFKKLGKGVFGEYSETRRALYLSSIECQDPEKAFGTMVHELTHYYDHVNGHISEKVYKQALKELGLRANGKEADNLLVRLVGVKYKKEDRVPEALAFAVELSQKGTQNKLAKKIFEIIMR